MKSKGMEFLAGSVGGYAIYKILDYVEPQVVSTILTLNGVSLLLLADFAFLCLIGSALFLKLNSRYRWIKKDGETVKYTSNPQEYWNHIERIRKSIEEDIAKSKNDVES